MTRGQRGRWADHAPGSELLLPKAGWGLAGPSPLSSAVSVVVPTDEGEGRASPQPLCTLRRGTSGHCYLQKMPLGHQTSNRVTVCLMPVCHGGLSFERVAEAALMSPDIHTWDPSWRTFRCPGEAVRTRACAVAWKANPNPPAPSGSSSSTGRSSVLLSSFCQPGYSAQVQDGQTCHVSVVAR